MNLMHAKRRAVATVSLALLLFPLCARAERESDGSGEPALAVRKAALERMLSERESPEAMEKALREAEKAGVSSQAILEARFLFHVDRQDSDSIAALMPEMLRQRASFRLSDSAIFSVEEDWLAVVEYVQAVAALNKGDKDAFKKHITEAFWLSPRQAAAYSHHIEKLRLDEAMRGFKMDFGMEFETLGTGEEVSVRALLADNKALFFHFWSPWSQECEAGMRDFMKTASVLSSKRIAVVSLVPGRDREVIHDARETLSSHAGANALKWLVDAGEEGLAAKLRVQNLPTMVIVSPAGEVLFNGSPNDPHMWEVLIKIDGTVERPRLSSEDHE